MDQPKLSGGNRLLMVNECSCGSSEPVAWLRRSARAAQRDHWSSDGRSVGCSLGAEGPEGVSTRTLPTACTSKASRRTTNKKAT